MPPKVVDVTWRTDCRSGWRTKTATIYDTLTPVLSCLRAAPAPVAAMLLIGTPPAACAVVQGRRIDIYANLSPGGEAIAALALRTQEGILLHELEHAFGVQNYWLLAPFLENCDD
jgi:hypothetical protein